MQKGILFAPLIIFIGVMVAAGCTGTGSTDATTQATPTSRIVHLPATVIPNATSPAANTSITTPSFNVKPTTTIDTSVYFAAADDPFMNKITFNVISWTISDCYMQEIFPDIVNNPNYGINASYSNITSISPGQFNAIWRKWGKVANQNNSATDQCHNVPINHQWDFVHISAGFTPRNTGPSNYEIATVVKGFGNDLAVFTTTRNLTKDKTNVQIESYIPLRADQTSFISSVELRFYKLNS